MEDVCLDLKLEARDLVSDVFDCTASSGAVPNIEVIYL